MAVSVVWSLQRDESAESAEFRQVLVRLSGKRLKRGRPPTPGILLSGLFVLLRIFDFLTHINFDLSQITQLQTALEKFAHGLLPDLINHFKFRRSYFKFRLFGFSCRLVPMDAE